MKIKEPFSSISHLIGAILSLVGMITLLILAHGALSRAAFAIYGVSLVLLYSVSAIYHLVPLTPRGTRRLKILDHVAIFLLIAGTYTPVALLTLHGAWGWALLGAAWTIAVAGIPLKIRYPDLPEWLSTGIYVLMGLLVLVVIAPLARAVPAAGLAWLVAGGLAYIAGAAVFVWEHPDPIPGIFGHHEIWHVLVLVGSGCHFAFMLFHVVPRA